MMNFQLFTKILVILVLFLSYLQALAISTLIAEKSLVASLSNYNIVDVNCQPGYVRVDGVCQKEMRYV